MLNVISNFERVQFLLHQALTKDYFLLVERVEQLHSLSINFEITLLLLSYRQKQWETQNWWITKLKASK